MSSEAKALGGVAFRPGNCSCRWPAPVILLALLACGYPTFSSQAPSREPSDAELVGLWVSQNCFGEAERYETNIPPRSCSWRLDRDGTFTMTDVPEWSSLGDWNPHANSGTGTWAIGMDPQRYFWVVDLQFMQLNGTGDDSTRTLLVVDEGSRFHLAVFVGDADAGFTMIFESAQ